jgi:cyclic pyranopterin phosphate synthase
MFCRYCRRLRLTSDGKLQPCLHAAKGYDIKGLLRSGAVDVALFDVIERALREKHRFTKLGVTAPDFSMQHVGG